MTDYAATPRALAALIEELDRLPTIGPKAAERVAYHLLRAPAEQAQSLAAAILSVRERTRLCSTCFNFTEDDPCPICSDPARDHAEICVVEDPGDILAIERPGSYKGTYHVLHGALSPIEGIGPDELKIAELVRRIRGAKTDEVILATNPNMEGDATATYVAKQLEPIGLLVTRLGRGLPMGSDLEYADELTVSRALEGRRPI